MIKRAADPSLKTLLLQEALSTRGIYKGELDNVWGPQSEAAYQTFLRGMDVVAQNTGTERTDWKGYAEVDVAKLRGILPAQARDLVASFLMRGKEFDLNPLFLLAISKHETAAWTSNVFRTKRNAMGISDSRGAIACSSYDESIRRMARGLSNPSGYYAKCKTLQDVANVYAPAPPGRPVGNDPHNLNRYWPKMVSAYWAEFERQLAT